MPLSHAWSSQEDTGEIELLSVYVPTNHIYIGDIFLLQRADVIRTALSVREGLGAIPASAPHTPSLRTHPFCTASGKENPTLPMGAGGVERMLAVSCLEVLQTCCLIGWSWLQQ